MFEVIWSYVKRYKWFYLWVTLVLVVDDLTFLVPTQVIQFLIDAMSQASLTTTSFWTAIGLLVLAALVNCGAAFLWNLHLYGKSAQFKFELQGKTFRKLVTMRTPFYEKFRSGDMMTRFSTDVEMVQDMVGYGLMIIVLAGGTLAFVIPAMFLISWQISLIGMLPLIVMTYVNYKMLAPWDDLIEKARGALSDLNDEVLDRVDGIRVTRAYSKRAQENKQFAQKTKALADRWNYLNRSQSLYKPWQNTMLAMSTALILFTGAYWLQAGQITLGQVVALELYTLSLVEPFELIADFALIYKSGVISLGKLNELVDTDDGLEPDGAVEATALQSFTLSDYQFSYPNSTKPSLEHISVSLKAGQTLGVVGKTGSGKTTFVRQFLRQYPVGTGQFALNDQPITDFSRASVEGLVAYVPQEHILFSRSVKENVAMGSKQASTESILRAIETAAFSEDLSRMSEGLETMIGERGVSISGGQKQRISIARAFLKEADLLILDDSLSAVDAKTERSILQNIQKERAGKTNIIVSHRLSAVHQADWVLVLDEGRIVEEGSPADLLAHGGWYYEQYLRQQATDEEVVS